MKLCQGTNSSVNRFSVKSLCPMPSLLSYGYFLYLTWQRQWGGSGSNISTFLFSLCDICVVVWSLVDLNPGFHLGVFVSNLVQ